MHFSSVIDTVSQICSFEVLSTQWTWFVPSSSFNIILRLSDSLVKFLSIIVCTFCAWEGAHFHLVKAETQLCQSRLPVEFLTHACNPLSKSVEKSLLFTVSFAILRFWFQGNSGGQPYNSCTLWSQRLQQFTVISHIYLLSPFHTQ